MDAISAIKARGLDITLVKKEPPPPDETDDAASATIEALKKNPVVYLNSSVQIFKAGSSSTPPPAKKPKIEQVTSGNGLVNRSLPPGGNQFFNGGDDGMSMSCDDNSYSSDENGWDEFGSSPEDSDGDAGPPIPIDYICRRCGVTFQSCSSGEYYYCQDCKDEENDSPVLPAPPSVPIQSSVSLTQPQQQSHSILPSAPPIQPMHYAKYSCKNCGVEFYSKVGNYNLCEVCSGVTKVVRPVLPGNVKKSQAQYLGAAIQRLQMSIGPQKHIQSLIPQQQPQGDAESPFSWGYTRKECKICGHDFYNRIENWDYCPKCVSDSCSIKSKKKKSIKKHEHNSINENSNENGSNIKTEVKTEPQDGMEIKTEPDENTNGMDNANKENKEDFPINTSFKFILYSCKLCKKTFYSNLADCIYCYTCTNANSITKRIKDDEKDERKKLKELSCQEFIKSEKYDKYTCKICSKEFYSSVGQWDFCNECNGEPHPSAHKPKVTKVVSSYTRNNVTFNRYNCSICKNWFFSSHEAQPTCKKCTRVMQAWKSTKEQEENDNSLTERNCYAKYICKSCELPFFSKAGEFYFCSGCDPELKDLKFKCVHCEFETNLMKELRKHVLKIGDDKKRVCACSQCSSTALDLAENEIQEPILYKCFKCEFSTKYRIKYKKHKKQHLDPNLVYTCNHCKYSSNDKRELKCHVMEHEGLSVLKCDRCEYLSRDEGKLTMHVAVVHFGETPYPCITCNAKFTSKTALKSHVSQEHDKPREYKCEKCDFVTNKKDPFKTHLKQHQENDVLGCSQCEYTTSTALLLIGHVQKDHGIQAALKCCMCNYKICNINQKSKLESHINNKHLKFIHKCKQCSFATTDVAKLKKHFTFQHHRPKTYKKNNIIQHCSYCEYTVKQVKRFMDHVATMHPDQPPIEPVLGEERKRRHRSTNQGSTSQQEDEIEVLIQSANHNDLFEQSYSDSGDESDNSDDDQQNITEVDESSPQGNSEETQSNSNETDDKTSDGIENGDNTEECESVETPTDSQSKSESPKKLRYECDKCDFKTSSRNLLRDHQTNNHSD